MFAGGDSGGACVTGRCAQPAPASISTQRNSKDFIEDRGVILNEVIRSEESHSSPPGPSEILRQTQDDTGKKSVS